MEYNPEGLSGSLRVESILESRPDVPPVISNIPACGAEGLATYYCTTGALSGTLSGALAMESTLTLLLSPLALSSTEPLPSIELALKVTEAGGLGSLGRLRLRGLKA